MPLQQRNRLAIPTKIDLPSPKKTVIPTNERACPEVAEGDLQFSFWAAQGFSPAITLLLIGGFSR